MKKAIVASMSAGSFRERYDTPGFCESIEKSFEWTDPAEVCTSFCVEYHYLIIYCCTAFACKLYQHT